MAFDERLVVHAVHLEHRRGQDLGGVALGLRDQRLALEVGERVDLGVGRAPPPGSTAGTGWPPGRPWSPSWDRARGRRCRRPWCRSWRSRSAPCPRRRRARWRCRRRACCWICRPGHRLLPHVLQRPAQRHPRAALRAGHQRHLLGGGGCGHQRGGGGRGKRADQRHGGLLFQTAGRGRAARGLGCRQSIGGSLGAVRSLARRSPVT